MVTRSNKLLKLTSAMTSLFLADIHDKDAIKQLVLEETDVIKNMSPASEIQEYFENAPTKKHIHVVIEYPLGKYFYPSIYELLLLPL
jgi:hypothetical protein